MAPLERRCFTREYRPGNRHRDNGTLYNVGNNGYSWSSSVPAGTNAYYLNFNNTVLNPQNTTNKIYGNGVRCVAR